MTNRNRKALILHLTGVFCFLLPIFYTIYRYFGPGYDFRMTMLSVVTFWGIGQWLIVKSKKSIFPSAGELIQNDTRVPILYLRTFKDDWLDDNLRWSCEIPSDKWWAEQGFIFY